MDSIVLKFYAYFSRHKNERPIKITVDLNRVGIFEGNLILSNPAFLNEEVRDSIDYDKKVLISLILEEEVIYFELEIKKIYAQFVEFNIKNLLKGVED